MKFCLAVITCTVLAAFTLTSCETPGQTTLLGAGTGAIIGNQSATGPLRGAALGAGIGYVVGKLVQGERERVYEEGYYAGRGEGRYDRDDRYQERPRYPVARPTSRYGFVSSPYSPHNLIDVRGIPHGARVVDPSVDRIFINP